MKGPIAFICPFWLPRWSGAAQCHYRMALALLQAGFDVKVLCGMAPAEGKDNGDIPAIRIVQGRDITHGSWSAVLRKPTEVAFRNLADHYAFIDRAVQLCRDMGIRVALIGNPFNEMQHPHARELFVRLKELGIKVGLIHHDLPPAISSSLRKAYVSEQGSWESASRSVLAMLRALASRNHYAQWTVMTGSPLFFAPDFIVGSSAWSAQLIDPLNQCEKRILHPLMDHAYWQTPSDAASRLGNVDLLMVNPQAGKNPELMQEVIAKGPPGRSYRVLKGGWGNAFSLFRPMLEALPESKRRQVDLVDYVKDMRAAYGAASVLLFPSLEEGYGMTAVEAMYCGVPVVSSSYPGILEAVGDGAKTLCPFKNSTDQWLSAIDEVLTNREAWKARALQRAAFLSERQKTELDDLTQFLEAMIA